MISFRSKTLPNYPKWIAGATDEQASFADKAYLLCEKLYDHGGDEFVELVSPDVIVSQFRSLDDLRKLIKWPG